MTKNQLQYWELRWKQHYQQQELDLKFLEHKLNAEEIALKWAQLEESKRAAIVSEAISAAKAKSQIAKDAAEIEKIMVSKITAMNDMYLTVMSAEREAETSYLNNLIKLWDTAFSIGGEVKIPGMGSVNFKSSPGVAFEAVFGEWLTNYKRKIDVQSYKLYELRSNLQGLFPNEKGWDAITNLPSAQQNGEFPKANVTNDYEDLGTSTNSINTTGADPSKQVSSSKRQSSVVYAGPTRFGESKGPTSSRISGVSVVNGNQGPGSDAKTNTSNVVSGTKVIYSPATAKSRSGVGPGLN